MTPVVVTDPAQLGKLEFGESYVLDLGAVWDDPEHDPVGYADAVAEFRAKAEPVEQAAGDAAVDAEIAADLTVKELKALAKGAGLRGYSKLREAELIDLLQAEGVL